jgi:hypothetical protein
MVLEILIPAVSLLVLLGVLPLWPYSRHWGLWPAAIVGVMLVTLTMMTLAALVPE